MLDLLEGVRVLDASSIVMGPFAAQFLGDLGADVIKLESPDGDLARASGSLSPDGLGALFIQNNRNKNSIAIDLKSEKGQEVLARLLDTVDVVIHNLRPKAALATGLDAARVREYRDGLVHCTITGYGSDGAYAGRPAYDDIIQADSGMAALCGAFSGTPSYVPSIIADKFGAMYAAQSILAALLARQKTGKGCAIEVPLFECLVSVMMNEHLDAATYDESARLGYGRVLNPSRKPFATRDGWLAVTPYSGRHWTDMLQLIGNSALIQEEWFSDASERNRRADKLYAVIADALPARTSEEWVADLERLEIPHARVTGLDSLFEHRHLKSKQFFKPTDDLTGRVRSVPLPTMFPGRTSAEDKAPQHLGASTRGILQSLGYDARDIDNLLADRIAVSSTG